MSRKGVPQMSGARKECVFMKLITDKSRLKSIWMVGLSEGCKSSSYTESLKWRQKGMQLVGAPAMEVAVKQRETGNISAAQG